MEKQDLISALCHILIEFRQISLAYLFGSQVTGDTGPISDIDIAVLLTYPGNDLQLQAELAHAVRRALRMERVDIVLLHQAPVELTYHIIAQGIVILQRDLATRVEYEAFVLGRYGDYLPILRAQRQQILQGDQDDRKTRRYREAFRRTETNAWRD